MRKISPREMKKVAKLSEQEKVQLINDITGKPVEAEERNNFNNIDFNVIYTIDKYMKQDANVITKRVANDFYNTYVKAILGDKEAQEQMKEIITYNKVNTKLNDEFNKIADKAEQLGLAKVNEAKPSALQIIKELAGNIRRKLFGKKEIEQPLVKKEITTSTTFAEKMFDPDASKRTNRISDRFSSNRVSHRRTETEEQRDQSESIK